MPPSSGGSARTPLDAEWRAKLERAEQALRKLEAVKTRCPTIKAYLADSDGRDIAERNIQVAVETVIDLANRLVALKRWPHPPTAALAIETLVDRRVLGARLGTSLIAWIKTRNVVVHLYARIDNRRIYRSLGRHRAALRQGIRLLSTACGIGAP